MIDSLDNNKTVPLFSVVIANYNHGNFIEEAIKSVLNQSCTDFELIIVDGGSTDNSVEIIKKYEDKLAWWVSEPDQGQSDAFNKGFAKAKGRYLTWLNADDILLSGTFEKFVKKIGQFSNIQWVTGNFIRFNANGRILEWKRGPHYLPDWLQRPHAPIVVFGPTSFFSRTLFQSLGGMDERLHYIMDTDLWIRFMKAGVRQVRLNHCCWAFRMHEDSKTAEFENHKRSQKIKENMHEEWEYVLDNTNYRCSRLLRITHLIWRIVDGSLIYSCWLQRCKRHLITMDGIRRF